jgi:hypothetical protein
MKNRNKLTTTHREPWDVWSVLFRLGIFGGLYVICKGFLMAVKLFW